MASISVYVRIRPMIPAEISSSQEYEDRFRVQNKNKQIQVELSDKKQKIFKFNQVFQPSATQQQMYEGLNLPSLTNKVLDGYHSTIFAYGQTGSGKTYTIDGPQGDPGLVPRVFQNLFTEINQRTDKVYKVILSFVQIYNEGIYDLIDVNGKPLKMRWNKHQQFIVQNLFEVQCRNHLDALKWWSKGQKNKVMGSHKMNLSSSRSHCLLTLRVTSYQLEDPSNYLESKFEIVDLAGSERQKVTKSEGVIFREGIQINKSLFTLRQVIACLYDISQGDSSKHIPYRDSKLTSLLKQSIGGNTFCSMIACLNPTSKHFEESLQTLTYASMASFINNSPSKNIDPKIRENEQLREQNQQYKKDIKKMAEHIDHLTKMLEAGMCISCQNGERERKNKTNSSLIKIQRQDLQVEDENQPSGILRLPNVNSKENFTSDFQNASKNVTKTVESNSRNQVKVEKKTLKTTKDVLESITMIKELINANSGLRQKIEGLKRAQEAQQKQIFGLNKENQILRDRWDMMNDTFVGDSKINNHQNEAPISAYERLLKEQQGMVSRVGRMYSQNSHSITSHKNTSYNEFLKKNTRQEGLRNRKITQGKRFSEKAASFLS